MLEELLVARFHITDMIVVFLNLFLESLGLGDKASLSFIDRSYFFQ